MVRRKWWIFGFTSDWLIALVSLLLFFTGCAPLSNQADPALVNINGYEITIEEFERSYVQKLIQTGANDTREARFTHLDRLIEEHLWYEEALRRNLDSDSSLIQFSELALRRSLGGRFYELELIEKLPLLEETEIRQAFERYKQPVIGRHLFYRNETEAQSAHARLLTGTSFLDEAQRSFRTSSFDSTAGWIGEIRYFQVDDAIAEAAFGLNVGSFSDPVRSRQGWHILKIEDRSLAPIISETEFQTRKSGIANLLRIRKRRLEGDRFIRSFMEERRVEVIPEGIRSLSHALNRLTNTSVTLDKSGDTPPLPLLPTTPLATFVVNDSPTIFTAGDYFLWFSALPFSEATDNPAASLGRAIRNEALAIAALDLGLENDPIVLEDIKRSKKEFLANFARSRESDSLLIHSLVSIASIQMDSVLFHEIMVDENW